MNTKIYSRIAAIALALTLSSPSIALAQEPQNEAQLHYDLSLIVAREIIDIGLPEDVREETFLANLDQMAIQSQTTLAQIFPTEDPEITAIIDKHLTAFRADSQEILSDHLPNIIEGWAKAYANIFTYDELIDIRDFVTTRSGQRFFQLSSAIAGDPDFVAANQAYAYDLVSILPRMQEDLREDLSKYSQSIDEESSTDDTE